LPGSHAPYCRTGNALPCRLLRNVHVSRDRSWKSWPYREAELVEMVHEEIRIGRSEGSAFESNHLEAGRALAELAGDDAADHAEANKHHVYFG
jgi:hypothetical protein